MSGYLPKVNAILIDMRGDQDIHAGGQWECCDRHVDAYRIYLSAQNDIPNSKASIHAGR